MPVKKCLGCKTELEMSEGERCHGLHERCFNQCFDLEAWEEFRGVMLKHAASLDPGTEKPPADARDSKGSFFHGKFKKYAATLAGRHYILKVREEEAPELPDVEFVCNQIAKQLGLPVPWFGLIDFFSTRTFVTRNFVTEEKGVANLTHIYHFLNGARHDCENLLGLVSKETGSFRDQETFIHMCLLDSLVGNHDRHGRNLGILTTARGQRLAPIYDNPSFLGLESGNILKAQFEPKGRIQTQSSSEPTMTDYVQEFDRLGHRTSVERFAKKIKIASLQRTIADSTCTDLMKNALERLIANRHREIKNAISS